jgi:hypothetical protein
LPTGEQLRLFDLQREDPGILVALKEAVYDKPVDRAVFDWQYYEHPRSHEIKVLVMVQDGEIVASTTRLPATLCLNGADRHAVFNVDSMVHPSHRRRGRMRDLYKFARAVLPPATLSFSKGSSSQIYPLLMSLGHREIVPNTHLVSYPSAARWLMSRLRLRAPSPRAPGSVPAGFGDFQAVERFDTAFDAFFRRVSGRYSAIFRRDAALMNWRYFDIPHRRYLAFQRLVEGEISTVLVLAVNGDQGHIVDLLWDPAKTDDPARTLRLAQAVFDEQQVARVACFATHPRLREALSRSGFVDRGETPRFSAYIPPSIEAAFQETHGLHVVDGDGDTEYS